MATEKREQMRIELNQFTMLEQLFSRDGMSGFATALRHRIVQLERELGDSKSPEPTIVLPPVEPTIFLPPDDKTVADPMPEPTIYLVPDDKTVFAG